MTYRQAAALLLCSGAASAGAQVPTHATPEIPALRCPAAEPYDRDNAFARIIRGELPVSLIAQNARVMAFIPLGWDHPGHALVIPRRAARNLYDLTDSDVVAIFRMIRRVAVAQRRALGATGFSIEQNNGRRQDVCHAHFHVIPNTAAVATPHASRAEMDRMAARLRAALPPG